jgi:integrase
MKAQNSAVVPAEPLLVHCPITKSKHQPLVKPKLIRPILGNSSITNKTSGSTRHIDALAQAKNRLELALAHSHAPKTSKNYDYAVRRYIQFAASIGYSETDALPASEELILLWICEGLGKTGPGTAKQNLSALRAWHIKQRLPWHRPECIPFISKALREFWPRESKKPASRPPITSAMIMMLVKAWQGGTPKELCALAIALVAWCGQCRLGELLPESLSSIDYKRLPRRVHWSGPIRSNPNASELNLPWTKTNQFDGDKIFLLRQRYPLNATHSLSHHFAASPLTPERLLCEFGAKRSSSFLSKESFMIMCNAVWSKAGLPHITGHSFRIGGTTALLCSGVNPDVVKKLGRWSSDAFLIYWRSLGHLFSKHASDLVWND